MGIDNFHNWLKDNYKQCFISCSKKNIYNYIYIDANHILHNSMNGAKTEEAFVSKLYSVLDLLFCNFLATKKIVIAIDGTSPYSKIILQRKRRSQGIKNVDTNKLNSLHLTPGTDFMDRVNNYMEKYIEKMEKKYKFVKVEFEISPTTEPDEGEIKIFRKILKYSKDDPYSDHLVIGNDADLVILAMALKKTNNIHILIRHKKFIELLDVDELTNKFCGIVPSMLLNTKNWKHDFCMVSLMMGNDYLPKLNYIKYETIWKSYFDTIKQTRKSLIENCHFNRSVMIKFFENIILNISNHFRKFNKKKYNENMIGDYLEGLLWCLKMYESGTCPKYDYTFNYKRSPSPCDILHYLKNKKGVISIPSSKTPPINSNIYTLLLIPKKARNLIPKKYQKLVDNDLKYIYEMEDCKICNKLRSKLSYYHKQLKQTINDDTTEIRKGISSITLQYSEHKKSHQNEFSIDDISKIIKITK